MTSFASAQSSPVIATGDDFSLMIDRFNNLYAFGANDSGQLGVTGAPSTASRALLINPAGVWKTVAVSMSDEEHVLAVRLDGSLWAWGSNARGQLGDGSQVDQALPQQVGNATNWDKVAAGGGFSLALNDGELYAWGDNVYGQLGQALQYVEPELTEIRTLKSIRVRYE